MLELRTFGGLSITVDGAVANGAAIQRKTLALLALLAATKHGISRDKLVAYLWPESDTAHGRNLLRQACYALRRDLDAPELVLVPEGNPGAGGTILLLQNGLTRPRRGNRFRSNSRSA